MENGSNSTSDKSRRARPPRDSRTRGTRSRIIGIRGAVSLGIVFIMALHVPGGIAYGRSLVPCDFSIAEIIRGALASYAADNEGNRYPPRSAIASYTDLVRIVKTHAGPSSFVSAIEPEAETWLEKVFKKIVNVWQALWGFLNSPRCKDFMRFTLVEYTSDDGLSYTLTIRFDDVPDGRLGKTLVFTPTDLTRHY